MASKSRLAVANTCAGCLSAIMEGRQFLRCSLCKAVYDLQCANISEKHFSDSMTKEIRDVWKCQLCVCCQPRKDNSNTPVRCAASPSASGCPVMCDDSIADYTLDQSQTDSMNKVTFRRQQPAANLFDASSVSINTACLDNIRYVVRDELQNAISERLVSLISNSVREQFASIFDTVSSLSLRVAALENKLSSMLRPPIAVGDVGGDVVSSGGPREENQPRDESSILDPLIANRNVEDPTNGQRRIPETVSGGLPKVEKRPRKSLDVKRGTAAPGTTQLEASERRQYIHVYYLKLGTTGDQVRAHVSSVLGREVCAVEALKARGDYASFKLSVPSQYAGRVLDPENWAKDICVKPWRQNFRSKNQNKTQENA